MKILKTKQFISERMKIMPITNDEFDKVSSDFNIVKPGDKLNDYDMILVACKQLNSGETKIEYGCYRTSAGTGYIMYSNSTGLPYDKIRDKFEYTFENKCTHYIVKIFRPDDGIDNKIMIFDENDDDFRILDKKLETDPNYKCVYINKKLCEEFNIQ
jgi:hypothetical protein